MLTSEIRENLLQNHEAHSVLMSYDNQVPEFPVHWHSYVECIMLVSGELTVNVSGTPYSLKSGSVLFIWPCELHSVLPNDKPFTQVLQFDPSFMLQFSSFSRRYHLGSRTRLITAEEEPSLYSELSSIFYDIYIADKNHKNQHTDPYFDYHQYSHVCRLMIALQNYEESKQNSSEKSSARRSENVMQKIQNACTYIAQNFENDLTLTDVADYAGISKFYFSRSFEKYTGTTFNDYVAQHRLNYAKTLLSNPDNTITDIAMQAGFGSLASFNRLFSKSENMTPTAFRKLLIK